MKTIVYQSYRTHDVSAWTERCMRSVREWARAQGHDYRFIDDRLFDGVPAWYREAAGANVLVMTNLARLLVARELFAEGYDRTIWIDADIFVFDAEAFRIKLAREFAFCYEVWVWREDGVAKKQAGVNNSVSVFVRGNSFLDFCIWAHEDLVRRRKYILAHGTSTRLLSSLYRAIPFPLMTNVGMLSPSVAGDICDGSLQLAREYAAMHGHSFQAINLCGSLCGKLIQGRTLGEAGYDAIVDAIESSRGGIFRSEAAV